MESTSVASSGAVKNPSLTILTRRSTGTPQTATRGALQVRRTLTRASGFIVTTIEGSWEVPIVAGWWRWSAGCALILPTDQAVRTSPKTPVAIRSRTQRPPCRIPGGHDRRH
jgi:hypothetical protein